MTAKRRARPRTGVEHESDDGRCEPVLGPCYTPRPRQSPPPVVAVSKSANRRRRFRPLRWLGVLVLGVLISSILLVLPLRWLPPATSAFMLQEAWASEDRLRQQWTSWEGISPQIKLAVIASEDQRFPDHFGFDLQAVSKALAEYREGERLRGASTISQQVAKNLYLWPGKNFVRKAVEGYFTGLIELLWPKQRILEVYLNIAEFGPGVFGVEAAARQYFGKPALQLSAAESARLAAVLPNPKRLHAARPSAYVYQRQQWIQNQMRGLGGTSYLRRLGD